MTDTTEEEVAERVELAHAPALEVDQERRTIAGLILPYDVLAQRTSAGSIRFKPGSLEHHPELKRVKLLVDHDATRSVGYLVNLDKSDHGVSGTFHVPEGDDGDDALRKAAQGVRDGLSVGADVLLKHTATDGSHSIVTRSYLNEVSLVALPAFGDARVVTVNASQQKEKDTMSDQTTDAAPVDTPPEPTPAVQPTSIGASLEAAASDAPFTGTRRVTAEVAASAIAGSFARGNQRASDIMAALSDVVPADDAGNGYLRDQWLGEYWSASRVATPLFDLFSDGKELTSMTLKGWRWVTRPEVDDYAGNKTEIPSNPVKTAPAEAEAFRYAGGWDVDRVYVDLGNGEMIEALFQAAVEDSRTYLEAKVAEALIAESTPVAAQADLPAALAAIGLQAATIGANVSVFSFAGDVWAQFLAMGADALPWWVTAQTAQVNISDTSARVGNVTLAPNTGLPAGTILAGDRRAALARNKRVRVNAIDLPRGGVDLGVFGYAAVLVQDPRAVWTTSIGTDAGGEV